MPRDTNGTYTKPAGTTAVTGQIISSSAYNNLANDEADALTDSLSRSGKGGMLADLSMGGKKITNLANGTSLSDAVRRDQAIGFVRRGNFGGTSGGSANAQTIDIGEQAAYFNGMIITFIAGFTNTGGPFVINVNGLGGKNVFKPTGSLVAGDIEAGAIAVIVYNGVSDTFQLLNPRSALGTAATRNVGTAAGNLPEIVDGSGRFNSAVDAAHKILDNLTGDGIKRTTWSSCVFSGAGAMIDSFNLMGASRLSAGTYALSFPSIGGSYFVDICVDSGLSSENISHYVLSGSRGPASCTIITARGNSSPSPFDPDRVSVAISRIA